MTRVAKRIKSSSESSVEASEKEDLKPPKRKGTDKASTSHKKAKVEVPTLIEICQCTLIKHIDQLDKFNDNMPYNVLSAVFDRCTVEQLSRISEKNPRFHDEMNPIWERHVKNEFPAAAKKKKSENWYMAYNRIATGRANQPKKDAGTITKRSEGSTRRAILSDDDISPKDEKKQAREELNSVDSDEHETAKSDSKKSSGKSTAKSSSKAPKKTKLMAKSLKLYKQMHRR